MDALRSWIRERLGYRSWPYVFAGYVLNVYYATMREGVTGLRVLGLRYRSGPGVWIKLRALMYPIFIRPGTEDVSSIINNVFRAEYGRLPKNFAPRVVIDAGAYVGDTAAYFLSRFADATVIALEPGAESYQLAKQNLVGYGGRVILSRRALWKSEGFVRLSGDQTGVSVSEEGVEVEATTIPVLMTEMDVKHLDLLKLDIEGAEVAVLNSGVDDWLSKVKVLLLETHGREIEGVVIPMLEAEGFRIRRHRNVWYCFNCRSL